MSAVEQLQTFTVIMLVVLIFRGSIVTTDIMRKRCKCYHNHYGMLKKAEKCNGTGKLTLLFSSSTDTSSGRVAQAGNSTRKL